ncbi:MAG: 30S ribosomal protein S6 [bacterium]
MRAYETMIVISTLLGDEATALRERFVSVVKDNGGTVDTELDWGVRKLAYPIQDQTDGRYLLLEYQAEPAVVAELERTLRIADGVLRYISVQQDHTGLPKERPAEPPRDRDYRDDRRGRDDRRSPRGGDSSPRGGEATASTAAAPEKKKAGGEAASNAPAVQADPAPAAQADPAPAAQADPAPAAQADPAPAADGENVESGDKEVRGD